MEGSVATIRFDDVEIDPGAVEIRVGGERVDVQPQVFDVLAYLAARRERLVTKNELLDNVWGDRFVSESALTSRIKDARRAVGDDGRAQRVIRTVHGRGYQFVAEVEVSSPSPDSARWTQHRSGSDDFIGRDRELTLLLETLVTHRLVVVVGPGGVGKTRLAIEAARACEDEGRPVHIVELDSVTTHTQVALHICDALGVRSAGDVDPIVLAARELQGSSPLLVLDNFEHVSEAALDVDRLRGLADDVRICVTSRERLRISGEQVMALGPLDTSADQGRDAPALRLFESLARRFDQSFTVDEANYEVVSEICALVDGLPLGLDLAAAQLQHMPLDYLRTLLRENATTIGHDLRDRPKRQRTVGDLIEWSHTQLPPSAQRLLARLSVFRGGIPLSGVRAVGEFDLDTDALRNIAVLVDKSLVLSEHSGSAPRYALLNMIRAFADERLEAGDEAREIRGRHAEWLAGIVADIEADRWERNTGGWLDDLSREYPNLSAALEHLSASGDHATLADIVADTNLWWYRIGRHGEARRWVTVALAAEDAVGPRSLGRIHFLAGLMAFAAQQLETAIDHYRRAMRSSAATDDWRYLQLARSNLAVRALADSEALPDAIADLEGVVAAATERDEAAVLAHALNTLGVVLHRSGRPAEARAHHQRAALVNQRIGDRYHEALNHANLGHIEVEAGRSESALVSSKAALTLSSRIGASLLSAWMLAEIASAERLRGNEREAAVLVGASESHIEAIGAHHGPAAHQSWHELTVEQLRAGLGDDEFDRLHAEGRGLPFNAAIERALTS